MKNRKENNRAVVRECKDYEKMIPLFLQKTLNTKDLEEFTIHCGRCKNCKEELAIQYYVYESLRKMDSSDASEDFDLSASLDARMKEAIQAIKSTRMARFTMISLVVVGLLLLLVATLIIVM